MSAEPVPALAVPEYRVALAAHLDTMARLHDALPAGPERDLLLELVQAVGSATSCGRRSVDDMCDHVLEAYRDVLRGPT